ncbi:hypothetical protein ABW19_dt0210581 [Dactylella cylindrospora]|nr:hypothetical protein ABW19_dt0210581 [Dactylella cylindrospora]
MIISPDRETSYIQHSTACQPISSQKREFREIAGHKEDLEGTPESKRQKWSSQPITPKERIITDLDANDIRINDTTIRRRGLGNEGIRPSFYSSLGTVHESSDGSSSTGTSIALKEIERDGQIFEVRKRRIATPNSLLSRLRDASTAKVQLFSIPADNSTDGDTTDKSTIDKDTTDEEDIIHSATDPPLSPGTYNFTSMEDHHPLRSSPTFVGDHSNICTEGSCTWSAEDGGEGQ